VGLGLARGALDFFLGCVRRAKGDVLRQRAREQEDSLLDLGDLGAPAVMT